MIRKIAMTYCVFASLTACGGGGGSVSTSLPNTPRWVFRR